MTETYALPNDIEQKTGYSDDTTTDADLQEVLEEAHRDMEVQVGRHIQEEVTVTTLDSDGNVPSKYVLDLRPIFKVDRVQVGDVRLQDGDYTVNKEEGTIEIDSDVVNEYLEKGRSFTVFYVPKHFKDLEVWLAVTILRNQEVIQVEDDQIKAQAKNSETKAAKLRNQLNRKRAAGTVTDGSVSVRTP